MKIGRRILTMILALCLVLTGTVFSAEPQDVQEEGLMKKLRELSCLGILYDMDSGGNFRPDDVVTRGETALYMTQLLGLSTDLYSGEETIFSDVTEETENYEAIYAAATNQIISGYPDGTFRPDEAIVSEEVIKILVCALGYQQLAELQGGYPSGYLLQAADIQLLKGVECVAGEALQRKKLAVLLYNALHTPILMADGYSEEGTYMSTEETQTILTERLNCQYGKGVVTANSYTGLYEGQGVGSGYVKIEDMILNRGTTEADAMIGMYVTFYAREEGDGEYTILGIWPDEERILTVQADDIQKDATNFRSLTIEADEKGKQITYDFSNAPQLIYNSVCIPFDQPKLITPDLGTVVLSDTDWDGKYDVLIVTSYELYIADRVTQETISYKNGKGMLDLSQLNIPVSIVKNGVSTEVTNIAQWDVVQVAVPTVSDRGICRIVATDSKAGGILNGISEDFVEIGGESYEIAKEYEASELSRSSVGENVIGLLDSLGRLVDIQKLDVSDVAGYLYEIGSNPGLEEYAEFEFFTENSEWVYAKSAETIRVNGVPMTPKEIVARFQCKGDAYGVRVDENGYRVDDFDRFVDFDGGDPTKTLVRVTEGVPGAQPFQDITDRQLLLFRLNNEGEVISIKTPGGENTPDAFVMRGDYTAEPGLQWRGGAAKALFKIDNTSPYAVAFGDEDTIVFQLPLNDPDNKEAYSTKIAYTYPDTDITLYAKIYGYADDTSMDSASYIVTSMSDEVNRTHPMLVEKVTEVCNEDGEVSYQVYGYELGAYVNYTAKRREIICKSDGELLEKGDFVELNKYADGTIESLYNFYSNDILINVNQTTEENMKRVAAFGGYRDQSQVITGFVQDVNTERLRVMIDNGYTNVDGLSPSVGMWRYWTTTWIYLIDMKTGAMRIATISDLKPGDFICAQIGLSAANAFAVYRNFEG